MTTISEKSLPLEVRDQVRQIIVNDSEPFATLQPIQVIVLQNSIHGLKYLPFDEAVRKSKVLLGGNGYLANEEYRQIY